jgi:hypothetical protein
VFAVSAGSLDQMGSVLTMLPFWGIRSSCICYQVMIPWVSKEAKLVCIYDTMFKMN